MLICYLDKEKSFQLIIANNLSPTLSLKRFCFGQENVTFRPEFLKTNLKTRDKYVTGS